MARLVRALVLSTLLSLAAAANPAPYYISAEVVLFDSGSSDICGTSHGASETFTTAAVGSSYYMGLYKGYTDETFTEELQRPAAEAHLGMLGPIISARVGDNVTIVFRNTLDFDVNLVPTGFTPIVGDDSDFLDPVPSNTTVTLTFTIPQEAGPTAYEPDTKLWLYKSMVDPTAHSSLGLIGPILIANASTSATDTTRPPGRDIITVTQIIYEFNSPLYEMNMRGRTAESFGLSPTELLETQTHHSINGLLYCAVKNVSMVQGETVRWHAAAIGSDLDLHNVHWHGNTITVHGQRADIIKMIPGSTYSLAMEARSPGTWMFHCHINDHFNGGMIVLYEVAPNATTQALLTAQLDGATRDYYVQAEQDIWDYAPHGAYMCGGSAENFTADQLTYVGNFSDRIGSRYVKGLYRLYTDDTYTQRVPRAAADEYLGLLGPIMKAEVGDILRVHFKNTLPFPVSMHPHGVWYDKSNEGTPYNDGTSAEEKRDDAVETGQTFTYTWNVPDIAGPGPADLSTKAWLYHSHTVEDADTYAGLVGALIIGERGAFGPDMVPLDVDAEVVLYFSVMNEQGSLFLDANMQLFLADADWTVLLNDTQVTEQAEGGESSPAGAFAESNLMHSINGFMYCNGPHIPIARDGVTRVHIISIGTEPDVHAPNFQRQNLLADGRAAPSVTAMPGTMQSLDVVAHGSGSSLLTCRTVDHINAGMMALYDVVGDVADPPAAEAAKTYYVQAETLVWNYVPLGLDGCTGEAFDENAKQYVAHTNVSIGPEAIKAVYRQYTGPDFATRVAAPATAGLLGPTLFAEVGQTFAVVFRNALDMDVNLAFDAGLIPLSNASDPASTPIAPNATHLYTFLVPSTAGPQTNDLSTVAFAYSSGVDIATHQYAGLVGTLVIGRAGAFGGDLSTDPAPVPVGVDHLYPLLFLTGDESVSPYVVANLQRTALDPIGAQNDTNFATSVVRSAINGFLFCNQPDLTAAVGSRVRFVLIGMGTETDLHAPAFTAQQLLAANTHTHSVELLPSIVQTVDVIATAAGRWPLYTETHVHYDEGMRSWFNVSSA
ncbi:FOX1 [Auxenochlorella protothecoides x Auxenochlorella symbiontica]